MVTTAHKLLTSLDEADFQYRQVCSRFELSGKQKRKFWCYFEVAGGNILKEFLRLVFQITKILS